MTDPRYYLITPLAYTGAASGFTYHGEGPELFAGQIVQVSVGRRPLLGVITKQVAKPTFKTKAITRALELPPVPPDLQHLAAWISEYYAASPASVWSTMLPSGLDKQRRVRPTKTPLIPGGLPSHTLTSEQAAALEAIRTSPHSAQLIQGITGSGKTRIYLELAAEALAAGRSVIILVPEITLAQQVVARFEAAFGAQVLASHSKLTEADRHRIWEEANSARTAGKPRLVVGPRSCLFMPVHQLGLIVVDECHEPSYKQEQHPRYHAVTTAAKRASLTDSRLIIGSATPGLAELYLAQLGRIGHVRLSHRANSLPLPEAKIIDLREKELRKTSAFLSQPLLDAMEETRAAGRQTLLYLNRRGSASSQVCGDCGNVTLCPSCQLPLTFHADLMRLICHHCNFRQANAAVCPQCDNANLRLLGGGTKRVESEVERLFPTARIARLDRDSATLSHIKTVFKQLESGELDILIGTQMIAKGLDMPTIDTVGIVSADTMLHIPDYTAAERTYQLISQVSGRAGRGDRAGRVFIQSYTPDHPALQAAATGAYDSFASAELTERHLLLYPPYVFLLKLTVSASTPTDASIRAEAFAKTLKEQSGLVVTGPAPAFIENVSGKYHWVITVKSKHRPPLVQIAKNGLPDEHWTADLDPTNLL